MVRRIWFFWRVNCYAILIGRCGPPANWVMMLYGLCNMNGRKYKGDQGVQTWYNETSTKTGRCITKQDQKAMSYGSRTQRTL